MLAVVDEAIDRRPGHDGIPKDLAPLSKPSLLVRTVAARSQRRLISWKKSIAQRGHGSPTSQPMALGALRPGLGYLWGLGHVHLDRHRARVR